MDNIIVIPIYKEKLNNLEKISIDRCFEVFSQKKIVFIHSIDLDISFYQENYRDLSYESFPSFFFNSVQSYNQLMMSYSFYKRFIRYDYMLIYQTDCYVFRDELDFWSNLNYDYIGGIWFENYTGNPEEGNKIWFAGNGGFSLRRIKKIATLLKPLSKIEKYILSKVKDFRYFRAFLFKSLRIKDYATFLATHYKENEDVFFYELNKKNILSVPVVDNALLFSWDRRPDFLHDLLGRLPFGAHGWCRTDKPYENNLCFWEKIIDTEGTPTNELN